MHSPISVFKGLRQANIRRVQLNTCKPSQLSLIMSETRAFGAAISGDRQFNKEFSEIAKAAIVTMLHAGKSARAVAREFNTSHSTVLAINKRWKSHQTVAKKPRSGRPRKNPKAKVSTEKVCWIVKIRLRKGNLV